VAVWLRPIKGQVLIAESAVVPEFHIVELTEVMCLKLKEICNGSGVVPSSGHDLQINRVPLRKWAQSRVSLV
jgi:hypothetical protein